MAAFTDQTGEGARIRKELQISNITRDIAGLTAELANLEATQGLRVPAGGLADFAEIAGITTERFRELFKTDPAAALTAFVKGIGRVQASGGDVQGVLEGVGLAGQRTLNVFQRLAGGSDQLESAIAAANVQFDEGGALLAEANKRSQTLQANIDRLKNVFRGVATTLLIDMLPAITTVVERFALLVSRLIDLPSPIKRAVVGITALAAGLALVIGPLVFLAGQFLISAGALLNFVSAGGAVGRIISVLGFQLLPVVGIIGAIGTAVSLLAVAWARDWAGIRNVTRSVFGDLEPILVGLQKLITAATTGFQTAGVSGMFDEITDEFNDFAATVRQSLGIALNRIDQWLGDAAAILRRDIGKIQSVTDDLLDAFVKWATTVGPMILRDLGRGLGRVAGGILRLSAPITVAIARFTGRIVGAFLAVAPAVVREIPAILAEIQDGFLDGIGPLGSQIRQALNNTLIGQRLLDVGAIRS
jgi:hypothetical protein